MSQTFNSGFAQAAYRAVTTLALVSPNAIVPRIVEKIANDMKPEEVDALSGEDIGIWSTPEGTTFVDGSWLCDFTRILIHNLLSSGSKED